MESRLLSEDKTILISHRKDGGLSFSPSLVCHLDFNIFHPVLIASLSPTLIQGSRRPSPLLTIAEDLNELLFTRVIATFTMVEIKANSFKCINSLKNP